MTNSTQWYRSRKKLLDQLKHQVKLRLGPESGDITQYAEGYKREFMGAWADSSYEDLLQSILSSRVVLGGDFHAFAQSQRVHLRLLRSLPEDTPLTLALECFETQHQRWVDAFVNGEMEEAEFLSLIEWEERWGFPWENYRPLLKLARMRGYRVLALNRMYQTRSAATLEKRDRHAASTLHTHIQQFPGRLIYVVYGDLHVAQEHLPAHLLALNPDLKRKVLRVFLNSERLYFRLLRQDREMQVEVLRKSSQRYCVLASPPWVKWQSYLMYLEQTYDQVLDVDDEEEFEDDADVLDYTDQVSHLLQWVCRDLDVQVKADEFSVYTSGQRSLIHALELNASTQEVMKMASELMKLDRSFYHVPSGVMYLSRTTINHAASLAGLYLQAQLSGREISLWNMPKDFIGQIWVQALAFFASKLVNHKRKADSLRDLKTQLSAMHPSDRGREPLLLALDQRLSEIIYVHSGRVRKKRFHPRRKASYFQAARILGQMMGEKMFVAYRSGRLPLSSVKDYFSYSVENHGFTDFYSLVVKRLESHSLERTLLQGRG